MTDAAQPARLAMPSATLPVVLASGVARSSSKPAEAPLMSQRSVPERLSALLKHRNEALSPRALRRTLVALQSIVDTQVSEVEGGRRARSFADWYSTATQQERHDAWLLMSEQFSPKSDKVKAAREQYELALGTPEEGAAEIRLRRAFVSPRTRLLQRFSVYPEGMRFLVDLRADLAAHLKADKRLLALDAELEHLFGTWFDVGFLELRRISWDSPASLIEKLIKYEAVHAIKGWADVKNRLDSDRRCYGFFHPRLVDEPLIFVEVAFTEDMADSIVPLLDESAAAVDMTRATRAIFYSISNTQPGLRGVSFGDSLIKRVVETLREEFPKLKVFATLSPIPGFRSWLAKNAANLLGDMPEKDAALLQRTLGESPVTAASFLRATDSAASLDEKSPVRTQLLRSAATYLGQSFDGGKPADPVARFHLGNGARVERINWMGDPSPKGLKQSYGMMVNYLYDLKRLDKHRSLLAQGKIPVAPAVQDLYS
jgi:malonyl-CoA decarboxylase